MFGSEEFLKARQTAGQVFFLSAALGVLLAGLILAAPDSILKLFGATEEILPLSRLYLVTVMPGVPFLFLIMMINNLLRAEGRPDASMYSVFFIAVVSAILEPLLIFGLGPFPRLEIQGAALATVISQISGALLSFYYLQQKSSKYRLKWKHLRPNLPIIFSIYSTGMNRIRKPAGACGSDQADSGAGSVGCGRSAGVSFRCMSRAPMVTCGSRLAASVRG